MAELREAEEAISIIFNPSIPLGAAAGLACRACMRTQFGADPSCIGMSG
jgi:hypothetical protein